MLHSKFHDSVDDVVVVLFKRFDGFGFRDTGLCHNEFDVLVLDAFSVDFTLFLGFLFFLLDLSDGRLGSFGLLEFFSSFPLS